MKVIYLIRGLPGSGKSTLACKITNYYFEADDFFIGNDGIYRHNPEKISDAHAQCQNITKGAMQNGVTTIAVANTFVRRWEMQVYHDMAKDYGYQVVEVICKGPFKSIHNVPEETLERMRLIWEN